MKIPNNLFLLSLLTLASPLAIKADFWDDDYEVTETELEFLDQMIEHENEMVRSGLTHDDLIGFATGFNLQETLQKDLYIKTSYINTRPLHDLPSLQEFSNTTCLADKFLDLKLFYTQTRRAYFTKNSEFIDSYISTKIDFLEEFDKLDDASGVPNPYDIPEFLNLLSKIKLEERRIGGMFDFHKSHGCFSWRAQLPIYYIEHNFFLTPMEQQEIDDSKLGQFINTLFPVEDDDAFTEFTNAHLVNDLIGLGDLRLQARWDFDNNDCMDFTVGTEINLPTGRDFKNGLIGNEFEEFPLQPRFDIYEVICIAFTDPEKAKLLGFDLGTEALDRLARVAAATRLGTDHVGLGGFFEWRCYCTEELTFFNKLRIHQQLGAVETRFFKSIKDGGDFNRNYGADSEGDLRFLSEQLVNTFYPFAARAHVKPGTVIEWTCAGHLDWSDFSLELGYDLWYQAAEQVHLDDCPGNVIPQLDICAGEGFSAMQNKAFIKAFWNKDWKCHEWRIGLVGDATFGNDGIGKDWTVGLDLALMY